MRTNNTNKLRISPATPLSRSLRLTATNRSEPVPYPRSKRAFDVTGAILGLIFIAPFVPIIYASIKLNSRGKFIVGLNRVSEGKVVKIYKFRTMINDAHKMKVDLARLNERTDGPFFKIKDDPRITKTGKILRKFRIDEFPQLLNVLRGELALVGPRPHEIEEVSHYPEEYQHVPKSRAGVTGLSQVNGASSLAFIKELELDDYYVNNQSLALDTKIIFKTIKILFSDPTAV